MNAEHGTKPITCPKPVLRRRIWSSYALESVVNFDFQWAGRHPAHQRPPGVPKIQPIQKQPKESVRHNILASNPGHQKRHSGPDTIPQEIRSIHPLR